MIAAALAVKTNAHRDALIVEHLSLVRIIASHVQRSVPVHVELDDLVHAGTLGLVDAAEKYEAGKEIAFPAYAKHRIRGAILDSMRQADWASRDLRRRYKQVDSTRQTLAVTLGREASDEEVASALGLDQERWNDLMIDFRNLGAVASQNRADRDDERPSQEIPCAASECPDHVYARRDMHKQLDGVLSALPARHRHVLVGYYKRDLTMRQIGEEMGIRESRVSQIHKAALASLHELFNQKGIACSAALAA